MQQAERIAVIKELFGCPAEVAEQANASMHHRKAACNNAILHQGDESGICHLVVDGHARAHIVGIDGQYVQIATYEPGEIFGSYPEKETQRADIIAGDGLELLIIESARLAELADGLAPLGGGLSRIFSQQMGMLFDRMAARVMLSANGRVYAELLRLADRDNVIKPAPVIAAIAVSVQTARETASRACSNLQKRGIIEREKTHWRIVAPRQLEDMIA